MHVTKRLDPDLQDLGMHAKWSAGELRGRAIVHALGGDLGRRRAWRPIGAFHPIRGGHQLQPPKLGRCMTTAHQGGNDG